MSDLRLIFAGSGAFGLPTLAGLKSQIVQVISQAQYPRRARAEDYADADCAVALEQNLPLIRTEDVNSLALPQADAMVVIAFGQKRPAPGK